MKKALFVLALSTACLSVSCSFNVGTNSAANNTVANSNASPSNAAPAASPAAVSNETKASDPATKCTGFSQAGKRFIQGQSFGFDFEPFKGSCFVTFGSNEDMMDAKDLPRGSTFYIYKDGKQVFQFPDAFDGQTGCWVDGVAFSDLNGDVKTDVIMAGKCLGARDSYPSNAVYANDGNGFTTNAGANEKLQELKTIDAIKAFVKKDVNSFF